jgi:pyruvate,water dikinase
MVPDDAGAAELLRGIAVSPSIARGPARIVASPDQFERIRAGDILVTRAADPGWTPVFCRISGLVMESGGQLSHGAVVAREYGLPAVAGIPDAMRRFTDGQEILVDGLAGTVGAAVRTMIAGRSSE